MKKTFTESFRWTDKAFDFLEEILGEVYTKNKDKKVFFHISPEVAKLPDGIVRSVDKYLKCAKPAYEFLANAFDSINIKKQNVDFEGKIKINVSTLDEMFKVIVEDNGTGVHEKIAPNLFKYNIGGIESWHKTYIRMHYLPNLKGRYGDGLLFTRLICEAVGGSFGFKNLKEGAKFWYEVPIKAYVSLEKPISVF